MAIAPDRRRRVRLFVGETITPDAERVERLADSVERLRWDGKDVINEGQADLVRILRRAAALLHDEDRAVEFKRRH